MNVEVLGDDFDYAPVPTMLGADANTVVDTTSPGFLERMWTGIVGGTQKVLATDTAGTTVASRLLNIGVNTVGARLNPTDKANLELLANQPVRRSFFEENQTAIIITGAVLVGAIVILKTRKKGSRRRR